MNATYPLPYFAYSNKENIQAGTNDVKQEMDTLLSPPYLAQPLDLTHHLKTELPYVINYKLTATKHTKVFQCRICAKEFGHQYTLMRHLPTHTDERKFECTTCGKSFRQMSTLSQHRAIHSQERPFVCELCKKTFNRVSTLISHRKTHMGRKPHQCNVCKRAFHQKGNLRNHIFTHTNARPYKCSDCGKGFNQMSNLMCHKMKTHNYTKNSLVKQFPCTVCAKQFAKRSELRNHEQYAHTPVESVTSEGAIVLVEPIRTQAMAHALEANKIPFALLRPLTGIPVLVRVVPGAGGGGQMLLPAGADDLKKYGQISVSQEAGVKEEGTTVQIKIPVVATVVQQKSSDGDVEMAVVSPGPGNEGGTYAFTKDLDGMDVGCLQENGTICGEHETVNLNDDMIMSKKNNGVVNVSSFNENGIIADDAENVFVVA